MSAAGATRTVLTVVPLMSSPMISRLPSALVRRGRYTPLRLAAPTDEHLGLDDHRPADALGRGPGLMWCRCGLAGPDRHAVAGEDLLRPELLELHAGLLLRDGRVGSGSGRAEDRR